MQDGRYAFRGKKHLLLPLLFLLPQLAITVVFLLRRQILKTGVRGAVPVGLTGEMPIPTPARPGRTVGGS